MPDPGLLLMMMADGRLPTGGHTQSAGLEPAVRAGLGGEGTRLKDVPAYAADRLRTVVAVEAGTAVVARHALLTGQCLSAVAAAWAARTPSDVLRAASRRQGRGWLRWISHCWPDALLHLDGEPPRPVVLGVAGALAGLSARELVHLVGYDDVQTVVSAALKLLPADPAEASGWLLDALPAIEHLAEDLAGLTDPDRIPACGAPLMDAYAHAHTHERTRLFHA